MKVLRIAIIIFIIFITGGFYQPPFVYSEEVNISATVIGCGDGIIQGSEQCDGAKLGGATCVSLGFASGSLSCSSSCVFSTSSCNAASSGGGGGGGRGGGNSSSAATVSFLGKAPPKSTVILLKDAQITASTVAGSDAAFQVTASGIAPGNYIFSVYAGGVAGNRSPPLAFPVNVITGGAAVIKDIVIGFAATANPGKIAQDVNGDSRVNLVDFSILAHWQGRESIPQHIDLNQDGIINLIDFSIMAYYWTG